MAGEVAPWNLLQIAFIVVYPAWLSFTRMPSGKLLLLLLDRRTMTLKLYYTLHKFNCKNLAETVNYFKRLPFLMTKYRLYVYVYIKITLKQPFCKLHIRTTVLYLL